MLAKLRKYINKASKYLHGENIDKDKNCLYIENYIHKSKTVFYELKSHVFEKSVQREISDISKCFE